MIQLAFCVAAAIGGVSRHLVNRCGFGWRGTAAVNAAGSLLLGMLTAADLGRSTEVIVGTGALGAFTTFSALSLETTEGSRRHGLAVVAVNLALGLIGAAIGAAVK